jgi:hypothetical protein
MHGTYNVKLEAFVVNDCWCCVLTLKAFLYCFSLFNRIVLVEWIT